MTTYSPFYTFLTYLQLGSIMLTFVLLIIGIIGGILGIKALLIYIGKNKAPKIDKAPINAELPGAFSAEDAVEASAPVEEVEAEIVSDPAAPETAEGDREE